MHHKDLASAVVVVVDVIVSVDVEVAIVVSVAVDTMVVHLGPVHHAIGHLDHPILCPNHLDLYPILFLSHPVFGLDLYLLPSLSTSLVEVYLLDLSVWEGVQTMHHMRT